MSKDLEAFIRMWTHADYPPERVSVEQLSHVEQRLNQMLPQDYVDAVCRYGLPSTTLSLLEAITEQELDMRDVSALFSPAEILEQTEAWRSMGLQPNLIAFADDCAGNLFCFEADKDAQARPDSAPVWFFDHDFEECDVIAPSFETWIGSYGVIVAVPN